MGLQKKVVAVLAAASLCTAASGVARAASPLDPPDASDAAKFGQWSKPFVEPMNGATANDPNSWCKDDGANTEHPGKNVTCVPTAGSMAILGGPNVVYWDALEDMEEVETTVATEFGAVSANDQSRKLALGRDPQQSTWTAPQHPDGNDGSANASAAPHPLTPLSSTEAYNDAALFCAALTFLPDGRVMAAGGTTYYDDPSVPMTKYGLAELEGMANTRIYDPATNSWSAAGKMHAGRWYPTIVPLADGKVFVASGVTKLIKPLYPDHPPTDSGRNVVMTETYTPSAGVWADNGRAADRSLPLFPRLALIPGGRVYFNSAGQVFNPMGQAYDEVTWNRGAFYDPTTKSWSDGDIPGIGTPAPGFRGSTFSVMLPLTADAHGVYQKASFLTAGGIIGTTPGTYFAVSDSRIDTVERDSTKVTSASTGSLNQPRWYGTGVLTPTGEVIAFSGASADEVDGPGTAIPVTTPELFDPSTKTWTKLAPATEKRTYHNTAALLPDGRILVGGHAPIGTLYGPPKTIVPGVTTPQETRNPTFEIYSPPYLSRGDRPRITSAVVSNDTRNLEISLDPAHNRDVTSVMLMRRTAITHLVDGGQRGVLLPFSQNGTTIHATMPNDATVLPPGPYLVFVNGKTPKGPTPSIAANLTIGETGSSATSLSVSTSTNGTTTVSPDLTRAGAVPVDASIAFHEIAHVAGALPVPTHRSGQGTPWPTWPALVAVLFTGFWTLRRIRGGRLSRTLSG